MGQTTQITYTLRDQDEQMIRKFIHESLTRKETLIQYQTKFNQALAENGHLKTETEVKEYNDVLWFAHGTAYVHGTPKAMEYTQKYRQAHPDLV